MTSTNNTLEKIQREIRENLQREKELKNINFNLNEVRSQYKEVSQISNGISRLKLGQKNEAKPKTEEQNGHSSLPEVISSTKEVLNNAAAPKNGFTRRFIPNTNTRGVMQKFFKTRGKIGPPINPPIQQNGFSPIRIRVGKGQTQTLRNGYVPAEEKIVKELLDFQFRETELRNERMKSQPDLMAALELEESQLNNCNQGVLKSTKSMTNLYQAEDSSKSKFSSPT